MYLRPVALTVSNSSIGIFERTERGRDGTGHMFAVLEHFHAVAVRGSAPWRRPPGRTAALHIGAEPG